MKRYRGFTLIELMVVVMIIAILVAIGVVIFGNATRKSRDDRRIADINAIANAMEAHLNSEANGGCTGGVVGQYCALDAKFFTTQLVPKDPLNSPTACNSHKCGYCSKGTAGVVGVCTTESTVDQNQPPTGVGYMICANLETYGGPGNKDYYCRTNLQ